MSLNRRTAFKSRVISELNNDPEVQDLLLEVVDDTSQIVRPKWIGQRWHNADNRDAPEVMILVSVVTTSSERDNLIEEKYYTMQIEVEFSNDVSRRVRASWIDEMLDEIDTFMNRHNDLWNVIGLTTGGGISEPQWFEDRNRFVAVERYDLWRRD